jgi:cysteine-rich repeat protein
MTIKLATTRLARLATTLLATLTMLLAGPLGSRSAHGQLCGTAGVNAPQCDGQCPFGQMCADTGSGCACMAANFGCSNPANPNGPPVCWGGCPSATMVCATFASGCVCLQGPILCGNGVNDPGELCEDGNTINGDGCDDNCTPTGCGNGVATAGEECDGTDAGACFAGCQADCTCASGPPTSTQVRCFLAVAKSSLKFVAGKLKLVQACRALDLKAPGSCSAPDAAAVQKLEAALVDGIGKQCALDSTELDNMGFPGRCFDVDPLDGFTTADLQDCIRTTHTAAVDGLLALEVDPTIVGPLVDPVEIRCQSALAQAGAKFTVSALKSVQKCRNAVLKGKLAIPPADCATLDQKTSAALLKIALKTGGAISGSCTDPAATALKACAPDQISATSAAACIVATHRNAVDDPVLTDPADLIDYEYASPPVCGDNVVNPPEECDGAADTACPGLCAADCTCP